MRVILSNSTRLFAGDEIEVSDAEGKAMIESGDAVEVGSAAATDPSKLAPGEAWDATDAATAEAKKLHVDMADVQGTGAGGTVTKADVTAHDAKSADA